MSDVATELEAEAEMPAIKAQREKIARQDTEIAELKAAAKENVFLKAGLKGFDDGTNAVAKLLYDSYQGELTIEAITAAAQPLGLLGAVTDDVPPEEQEQTSLRQGLANGAEAPGSLDLSGDIKAAYEERSRILATGATERKAALPVINHAFARAAAGDPNYAWTPEAHAAKVLASGDMDDLI